MMDILQFYVSSFWVWAGITWGFFIIGRLIIKFVVFSIAAIKGSAIEFGD